MSAHTQGRWGRECRGTERHVACKSSCPELASKGMVLPKMERLQVYKYITQHRGLWHIEKQHEKQWQRYPKSCS